MTEARPKIQVPLSCSPYEGNKAAQAILKEIGAVQSDTCRSLSPVRRLEADAYVERLRKALRLVSDFE